MINQIANSWSGEVSLACGHRVLKRETEMQHGVIAHIASENSDLSELKFDYDIVSSHILSCLLTLSVEGAIRIKS